MRLLPRDERFFDLFTKVATLNVEAAKQLQVLLATDMDRRLPIVESIKRLEHEADIITHEVVTRLDRSFITPLDREDIHMLASRLDDVMDLMDGCSRKVQVFHAGDAPKGAILLAETIVGATEQLLVGVKHLDKSRNGEVLAGLHQGQGPRGGRGRDLPPVAGRPLQGRPRTAPGHPLEGDLRHAGEDPRLRRGRRQRAGVHLHQARLTVTTSVGFVLAIIGVALVFDFINGFHDSANSIATVVSTRVLSPGVAVVWAASFNFIAAFVVGTAVAKTISKGLIQPSVVDPNVVLAALLGAIIWNLVTW